MELTKTKLSILLIAFLTIPVYSHSEGMRTISYLNDESENHKMDIYYSNSGKETGINILAITSGGFVMTDKEDLKTKAIELSKKGFNVYVPNYSDVMYSEVCKKNHNVWFKPVQEVMAALAWLEKNEAITEIYIYGESAGGIIALNLAYLNESSDFHQTLQKEFGSKSKLGNHNIKIKGVFTVSAGVFDLSLFEQKNDTPLTMIHASCDQMVPYNKGTPLMCDEDAIEVFGSNAIFNHIKEFKTVPQTHLLSVCNANHDITDNNFIQQFLSFTTQVESKQTIKIKKEVFKPQLSPSDIVPCSAIDCK